MKLLKAVAKTFTEKLWKPTFVEYEDLCNTDWAKGFYLAHNLDGRGKAYDYAIAIFSLLSRWDPLILDRALEVYSFRYGNLRCISGDPHGEIMLGWSILCRAIHTKETSTINGQINGL